MAMTPATWGAAIEVPEKEAVPPLGVVEITFTPWRVKEFVACAIP